MVITTTTERAQPEHQVLLSWDLAPKLENGMFAFVPPPDAHKIDFEVARAAGVRSVQLGLMGEYRLTRVVALTLRGRYQPYAGQLAFQASSSGDPFTQFQADARLALKDPHPYSVIAGAAFLWDHFRFTVGVGYGNYFIPGLNIAVPGKGFVPDASLYFVL